MSEQSSAINDRKDCINCKDKDLPVAFFATFNKDDHTVSERCARCRLTTDYDGGIERARRESGNTDTLGPARPQPKARVIEWSDELGDRGFKPLSWTEVEKLIREVNENPAVLQLSELKGPESNSSSEVEDRDTDSSESDENEGDGVKYEEDDQIHEDVNADKEDHENFVANDEDEEVNEIEEYEWYDSEGDEDDENGGAEYEDEDVNDDSGLERPHSPAESASMIQAAATPAQAEGEGFLWSEEQWDRALDDLYRSLLARNYPNNGYFAGPLNTPFTQDNAPGITGPQAANNLSNAFPGSITQASVPDFSHGFSTYPLNEPNEQSTQQAGQGAFDPSEGFIDPSQQASPEQAARSPSSPPRPNDLLDSILDRNVGGDAEVAGLLRLIRDRLPPDGDPSGIWRRRVSIMMLVGMGAMDGWFRGSDGQR